MDGRWVTAILLFFVPVVGIAATVVWFSSNPVAIMVAIAAMILGGLYLLTYTESFA
ncbi:MAG TPA: hypothetical protein VMC82_07500 [Thermoplasmata archaeon]|nr:hypothetical protein [Thermoplasmata archaeon]